MIDADFACWLYTVFCGGLLLGLLVLALAAWLARKGQYLAVVIYVGLV